MLESQPWAARMTDVPVDSQGTKGGTLMRDLRGNLGVIQGLLRRVGYRGYIEENDEGSLLIPCKTPLLQTLRTACQRWWKPSQILRPRPEC